MKNILKSNWFLVTVSLLCAILIWIYVVYAQNPDFETTIKNVPIKYARYSDDFTNGKLTVLSKSNETVNVKISGKRTTLAKVTKDAVYCSVNMSDVNSAGTHKLPISVTFDVSGVTAESKDPHNVNVVVDKVVTIEKDISVETIGTPADGYIYDSIEYSTDKVRLTGAKSIIDKVKKAKLSVDINGATDKIENRYKIILLDKSGEEIIDKRISQNISHVEVTCNILRLRSVEVSAVLSAKNTAGGKKVSVESIKPDKLNVLGSRAQVEAIEKLKTQEIRVNYVKDGAKIEVPLEELTPNVRFEDEDAGKVEVTLKVE